MRAVAQVVLLFLAADLAAFGLLLAAVWAVYRRTRAGDDTPRDTASFVAIGVGWLLAVVLVLAALWLL